MRLSENRFLLRSIYYPWILLPYPARRVVTIAGIWILLLFKRVRGIHRRSNLTPMEKMFTLSFWGIPHLSPAEYTLTICGAIQNILTLSLDDLKSLPPVEREVTLDCVGGSRNNCVMRGVPFSYLLDQVEPDADVETAIFHCADGYFTTHPIEDLIHTDAFMAYKVNGQETPAHGFPLRLAAPGKYGYKWAKWVVRIELVPGSPKGYWEQRGLPHRGWVGEIR